MEKSNIEDEANVVNSIMLWRIYDLLWLILADKNPEFAAKAAETHAAGQFLGPIPSFVQEEEDNGDDSE